MTAFADEQRAQIEQVLSDRRSQMDATRDDDARRAVLLADQASDLFFEYLNLDGLRLTAMFGMPTPAQQERAAAAAREMYDAATAADQSLASAITQLESAPDFNTSATLQQQRRELVETQRDRRVPFLRGVAALLHGEWNFSDHLADRTQLHELCDRLLSPLIDVLDPAAAREARLFAGLAKARLGQFDPAEMLFAAVARDTDASVSQAFAARMGGVINRTVRGGAQSGLDALISIERRYSDSAADGSNFFYRVLLADHRFMLHRTIAESGADEPDYSSAFAAYIDLLKADAGIARDAVRSIVFARLSNASQHVPESQLSSLPGLVTVAKADALAQHESTRGRGVALLEQSLSSNLMDSDARAAALFALGRALYAHGRLLFAAQRFIELAANFPADHQAQRAIELGVTIASDLRRKSPGDQEALVLLREGLNVLLQRYSNLPSINRWRYVAGRLAIDDARFDEADALFAQITPDAAEWLDAHFMLAACARARASHASSTGASDAAALHKQTIATIDRVQPIIEQGQQIISDSVRLQSLHDYLGLLRIYRADAQVQLNTPQIALQTLAEIDRTHSSTIAIAESLKVRIAAYQMMRQPEQAMREIERFVQTSPDDAADVLLPMLASMQRDVQDLLAVSRDEQALRLAQQTLLPVATMLQVWLGSTDSDRASHTVATAQRMIAHAFRLSARFADALSLYDALLRESPDDAELLLGKAECMFGIGGESHLAEAMNIFKRLAAAGPEHGATAHETYWLSQMRMMQILDRVNRNTDQILPRTEQLRQQDRELGGERFRKGFDALRMKYSASSSGAQHN